MKQNKSRLTFVVQDNVETQVFDWGKLFWLSEPRVTAAEKLSAGVVILLPGKGHDRHNHPDSEEILYVLAGTGNQIVEVDGETLERQVNPGILIHIPPGAYHSTINLGTEPMKLLAIYAPPGPETQLREMEGVVIEPPKK